MKYNEIERRPKMLNQENKDSIEITESVENPLLLQYKKDKQKYQELDKEEKFLKHFNQRVCK